MEYQYINIKIDETGKVFLEVEGVKGKQCMNLTKELEELLGNELERQFKTEYYDDDQAMDNFLTNTLP